MSSSQERRAAARRPAAVLLGTAALAVTVAACSAASTTSTAKLADAAAPNPNCTLIVPANPLSARGLATPYQLVATDPAAGPCNEANTAQSAFIQGAIIAPNGQLTLYNPLVVDQNTQPAAAPAPANVPPGSAVGLWFGFNGTNLTLKAANRTNSLAQGNCVNGLGGSIFGQFAYCNAPAFFQSATTAIRRGQVKVPPLGTAKDGKTCPTVRDFSVIDQDQSDNVTTHYLAATNGRIAQPNAAGVAGAGAGAADLANGSDNLLLTAFMDPTLGCTPWTVADQSNDNKLDTSLPLDELQAAMFQQAPVAIVPLNDPMTLVNNNPSTQKTNIYRVGVDQPRIGGADNGSGANYCTNLFTNPAGIQRVFADQALLATGTSPDPGAATNLFTFLGMRASDSFTNLNCGTLTKLVNPITLTTDANGVVTGATFTPGGATATPTATASTTATATASASATATTGTTPTASPTVTTSPTVAVTPTAPTRPRRPVPPVRHRNPRFHW